MYKVLRPTFIQARIALHAYLSVQILRGDTPPFYSLDFILSAWLVLLVEKSFKYLMEINKKLDKYLDKRQVNNEMDFRC
jgi:urea transporter